MFSPFETLDPKQTALQLVLKLPAINDSIRSLHFKRYSPLPILEERLNSDYAKRVLEEASTLRSLANGNLFPYWESVLVAASASEISELFVKEAAKHDPADEAAERFEITVRGLVGGELQKRIDDLHKSEVIALRSTCTLVDGSTYHIPMMDFRLTPGATSLKIVEDVLAAIHQTRGAILKSGRSFHYYGFDLLSHEEWTTFLARSLLLSPLTDARYIAHRLIEGAGSSRITKCELKPEIPIVERILS